MNFQSLDIPKYEISFLNNKINNYCLIIPVINEGKNIQNLLFAQIGFFQQELTHHLTIFLFDLLYS